jgi:subtilisin-like proprotein convertase family protein
MKRVVRVAAVTAGVVLAGLGAMAIAGGGSTTKSYETENGASIPGDGGTAGTELPTVNVKQPGKIKDVNVLVRGFDDRIGDVGMTLLPPRGPDVEVFRINAVNIAESIGEGIACDGEPITLDDSANREILEEDGNATGKYKPAEKLSALKGIAASGKWRLLLTKGSDTDGGSVSCFGLKIKTG